MEEGRDAFDVIGSEQLMPSRIAMIAIGACNGSKLVTTYLVCQVYRGLRFCC